MLVKQNEIKFSKLVRKALLEYTLHKLYMTCSAKAATLSNARQGEEEQRRGGATQNVLRLGSGAEFFGEL